MVEVRVEAYENEVAWATCSRWSTTCVFSLNTVLIERYAQLAWTAATVTTEGERRAVDGDDVGAAVDVELPIELPIQVEHARSAL